MPVLLRGWKEHRMNGVVPVQVAEAMLECARRFDVEAGGRFTVRNGRTIIVWSADEHPDGGRTQRVASIQIRWYVPTAEKATIWRVCWDPTASSCDEVCRAVELLAGVLPATDP